MSDVSPESPRNIGRAGAWWLVGCGIVLALSFVLGWMDDTTELTPDHRDLIVLELAIGLVVGAVTAFVLLQATDTWPLPNRIGFALACAFLAFLGFSSSLASAGQMIEERIDFPTSKTTTYQNVLMTISRAYQTHGKGRSWKIRTSPIWPTIGITEHDYDLMLDHRGPSDTGHDPDEIASRGYFCARVTVQKAGEAIRIMHAGGGALPSDSIIPCPADFERRPHL